MRAIQFTNQSILIINMQSIDWLAGRLIQYIDCHIHTQAGTIGIGVVRRRRLLRYCYYGIVSIQQPHQLVITVVYREWID